MNMNSHTCRRLLINVDMINGFVREGAMADPRIAQIVPVQVDLIQRLQEGRDVLMFVKDRHALDCAEFKRYPAHCVAGSEEAELISELKPFEEKALVYTKNSTSAIFAEGFLRAIEAMTELEEIIITGCCTDICIMNLAIPLKNYFDETDRNVKIIVPKNAVETYDALHHDQKAYNAMAFALMEQAGISVVECYEGGNQYEQ